LISQFIKKLYLNTEGGPLKRIALSLLIGGLFTIFTALFLIVPIRLEQYLGIPVLIISPFNYIIGWPLIIVGAFFMSWTSLLFFIKKGTPVPNTAPPKLITTGPYAFSRNPMHGGLFLLMFGIGFYNSSLLALLVFIPIYIYFDTRIHRYIEEPELEKRFGEDYNEYKKKTPRFLGWRKKV